MERILGKGREKEEYETPTDREGDSPAERSPTERISEGSFGAGFPNRSKEARVTRVKSQRYKKTDFSYEQRWYRDYSPFAVIVAAKGFFLQQFRKEPHGIIKRNKDTDTRRRHVKGTCKNL